ncbi:MAG: hypothetical protein WCR69_09290 [Sulfuricurvum sp.]
MKKIIDIDFGFPDAENYKRRETKQLFTKLFIQNEFLDQLCQPEISFLVGDKGTGKTAYSLFLSNNEYKNNKAFSRFIRETDYQKFVQLKKDKNLQLSDYTSIWKVMLMLLLSEEIYEKEPEIKFLRNFNKFKYLHEAIEEYYHGAFSPEIVNAMQFIEESSLSASILSKYANIAGEERETRRFDGSRFQINLLYIQKKFKDALSNIKVKNNHILFIDGIDIRPDNISFNDYLECIKGLANAVWELNNDFFPTIKDSKGRIRIVMLLRPDIFESLGLQNLNTKLRSNSVFLNWVTEYRNYKSSKIFSLIDNILNSQQEYKKELGECWYYYFNFDAENTNKFSFKKPTSFIQFLRYSYYRPRDIITMLDMIKQDAASNPEKKQFTLSDFKKSITKTDYSNYILGEIKDQLLFYYQQEEYNIFLKFFEFLNGKSSFTYDEYINIYSEYSEYLKSISGDRPKFTATANEFLQFLYDLNVIGYIEYSKDGEEKFIHWCFKERSYANLSPKIKENREYQIFYSLTKALKIGKEYSQAPSVLNDHISEFGEKIKNTLKNNQRK